MDEYFATWDGSPDYTCDVIEELLDRGVDVKVPELVEKMKSLGYVARNGRFVKTPIEEFFATWDRNPINIYDVMDSIKGEKYEYNDLRDRFLSMGYIVNTETDMVYSPMEQFLESWDRQPMRLKDMITAIRAINTARFDCANLVNRLETMGFRVMDQVVVQDNH
jgi:Fe2+ transport system protein FeoA